MFIVLRIGQCFQVLQEAIDSANIFGRAGSFAFQTQRIPGSLLGLKAALKEDFMLPTVAEVIFVAEAKFLAVGRNDIADLGP